MKKTLLVLAFALALVGASNASAYTFSTDLSFGSTHADVSALQDMLIAGGYLQMPAGVSKGYFGALTKAAVMKWQMSKGITPAVGFFGPISRAAASSAVVVTPTPSTPSNGSLKGGEASLEDFDAKDGNDSDTSEGAEGVEIMAFEFDVEDGDASVNRVDVVFQNDSSSVGDEEPWNVFDSLTLLANGKKVAELDASDEDEWSEEGNTSPESYRARFTGMDVVVDEGETVEFTIEADIASNVDDVTSSVDVNWTLYVDDSGIRATDGEGIDQYTGDDADEVSVSIEEEGGDDELTVNESDDDVDSTTLILEDNGNSDWYSIFLFELEADKDGSDISITELPVTVTLSSSTYASIVNDAEIVIDGKTYDDFSVSSTTIAAPTLTFDLDDEDVVVEADDTITVELRLKFNQLVAGNAGMTVNGEMTSANVDAIDAEGGDDLGASQLTGSALGDTHTLRTSGIQITAVEDSGEASAVLNLDTTNSDDQGKFEIEFEVTALDETAYVNLSAASTSITTVGATFHIENDSNTTVTSGTTTSSLTHVSGGSRTGNYVRVNDGQTAKFKLTVWHDSAATAILRAEIDTVNTNTSASTSGSTAQVAAPEEDFETPTVQVLN